MSDLYPELPEELDEQWCEALSGGPVSEPLLSWLEKHPEAAQELEELGEVSKQLHATRDATDPGPHYFESMAQEVLDQLGERRLVGGKVTRGTSKDASLWVQITDWFTQHPSIAWAAVMAVALVAILAWSNLFDSTSHDPISQNVGPDAGGQIEKPGKTNKNQWLMASVSSNFSADEILELQRVASQMDIDTNGNETLDQNWGFGVGAGTVEAMGHEDLERAIKALEAPL